MQAIENNPSTLSPFDLRVLALNTMKEKVVFDLYHTERIQDTPQSCIVTEWNFKANFISYILLHIMAAYF